MPLFAGYRWSEVGATRRCVQRLPAGAVQLRGPSPATAICGSAVCLLHRCVDCLGEALLPGLLPAAVAALLPPGADAADVCDAAALLGQLAARFRQAAAPLLEEALPVLAGRAAALLPPGVHDWTGAAATVMTTTATNGVRAAAAASAVGSGGSFSFAPTFNSNSNNVNNNNA